MAEAQELTNDLLTRNAEYRRLASKHHELDDRLHELLAKSHPSNADQLEESTIKKRKLQLKDKMERLARTHRGSTLSV